MVCTICEQESEHLRHCPKTGDPVQRILYEWGIRDWNSELPWVLSRLPAYLLGRQHGAELFALHKLLELTPAELERLAQSSKVRAKVEARREELRLYEAMRSLRRRRQQKGGQKKPSKRKKQGVHPASA